MLKNRFFTLMVIPERTSQVRRFIIPAWVARSTFVVLFFCGVLGVMMVLDYWHVLGQIEENKDLKIENRRLEQEVQIFRNKLETIESTMERIRTFESRLRVITNLEDRDDFVQRLNSQELPDAATNTGAKPKAKENSSQETSSLPPDISAKAQQLDDRLARTHASTMVAEQELQDLYELLVDHKTFLAALPTRRPATGYFTSGFGVRRAPYGGEVKMHEGLDIANHPGTTIISPADGRVTFAGMRAGYGRIVVIDHGYGLETWYGHTQKTYVNRGDRVYRGQKIAAIGNTGRSTGPHVHYEVRVHGIPVDPLSYILED